MVILDRIMGTEWWWPYQNFVVLNLVFSAALLWIEVGSGNLQGSVWHKENGELKLRNIFSCGRKT